MSNSCRATGYPSDLTDTQWLRLEPLVPKERPVGRHRSVSPREIANAINYRWETGCVWRMLPHDFPPWGTVYAYFRDWQRAGVVRHLRDILMDAPPRYRTRSAPSTVTPASMSTIGQSPLDRAHQHRNSGDPRSKAADDGFSSPLDRADSPFKAPTDHASLPE